MAATSTSPVPLAVGLSSLADRYDGFILDLWGVLHDGVRPYPGAVATLRRLKAAGKRTVILSNGPRRAAAVAGRTAEIGIGPALYDGLHSSGEEAWQSLRAFDEPVYAGLVRRAFLLVPERDRDFLDGLDLAVTTDLDAAGFVLVTGLADAEETLADYEPVLAGAASRGRPMICANPDL